MAVLRAQLEVMRNYDQRLLETVFWSLGGVLTIVILLTGFGWFANFRVYDRDRQALRQELQAFITTELTSQRERISAEISQIRTQVLDEVARASSARVHLVRRRLLVLEYKFAEAEAQRWERDGTLGNAAKAYMDVVAVALELEYDWLVAQGLQHIARLLERGADLVGGRTADLLGLLGRVPEDYAALVSRIRRALEGSGG